MSQDETAANEVVESTAQDSPSEEQSTDDFINGFDSEDDTTDSSDDSADDSQDEENTTEENDTNNETSEVNPKEDWESLKGNSQDRFRQMANEKRELARQVQVLKARQAQFANEQELLNEINPETGDYYTPQEIERLSWQTNREAQAQRDSQELYNLQVKQNQGQITEEASNVVEQFPILNPESKDYNQSVADSFDELLADNLLFMAHDGNTYTGSVLKANGIDPMTQTLVGAQISPYKLAKSIASAYNGAKSQGEVLGQAKAQKATAQMMSNVDIGSNSSGARGGSDTKDFVDSFFD